MHDIDGSGRGFNSWPGGRVTFYDPRGIPVPEVAPPTRLTAPLEALATRNRASGVDPAQARRQGNRASGADPVEALREQYRASGADSVEARREQYRVSGADPVEALREQNRLAGTHPDGRTAGARWKRERDIPTDIWASASEAMG